MDKHIPTKHTHLSPVTGLLLDKMIEGTREVCC
jgi:hypothetical protein